jgi:hypothetical protein
MASDSSSSAVSAWRGRPTPTEEKMKIAVSLLFLLTGGLFLLVSTVFFPAVVQILSQLETRIAATPDFWDLSFVLRFVRVVFFLVGIFLIGFGIALFWLRKHWAL